MASYLIPVYLPDHNSRSLEEKENDLETAIKEHPGDAEVLLFMQAANYFMWPQKHDKCIAICEKFIKESSQPNLVSFAYWYAALLYFEERKNYAKAVEYFTQMMVLEPDNVDTMLKIAEVYSAEKKWDEALIWTQKAAADEDYAGAAYQCAGDIYLGKNEYDEAIAAYNKALGYGPENKDALCGLGRAYAFKKNYITAKETLHKALELDKENADVLYYLGLCWQEENDFYRAMDFYTKALRIQPGFPEVYNNIGKLYYDHEGDYKGAIGYFEKSIAAAENPLQQNLAPVYLNLGKIYRQMLDDEKANYYQRKWYECQGLEILFDLTHGTDGNDDEDDEPGEDN